MRSANVELVRDALEAVAKGDATRAAELFAADAQWHNTEVFPGDRVITGLDPIRRFWAALNEEFAERTMEIEQCVEHDHRVVAGLRSRGKGKSSGVPLDVRWGALVDVHDGRITRVEIHGSYEKAAAAAG